MKPRFYVEDSQLKIRNSPVPQLVITNQETQNKILQEMHEELGHRGIKETYKRINLRFWWPSMKQQVKTWIQSCQACQKRSSDLPKELGMATVQGTLFQRVSMDAVHIKAGKWKYLIVVRDDFSGWAETIGLPTLGSARIAEWFKENWIYRYGVIKEVTVDGGGEFKNELKKAVEESGSKIRITTPYYPEAQGMIERGHRPLKDALVKMCGENGSRWKKYLPLVTFADRISTKRTTGYSPYELVFGQKAALPVDLELETYLGVDWTKIKSTEELLIARTYQLEKKEEIMEEAYKKMKKSREGSVKYWDKRLAHRLRQPLQPGELVLVYNKKLESQWGLLFKNRWNGPYKIVKQVNQGPYIIEELDGTEIRAKIAAAHVKRFYPRGKTLEEKEESNQEEEEEEGKEETLE